MFTTLTTTARLDGARRRGPGPDLRGQVRPGARATRDAALVVATLAILLLVAT